VRLRLFKISWIDAARASAGLVAAGIALLCGSAAMAADTELRVVTVGKPQVLFTQTEESMCAKSDWLDSPFRAWHTSDAGIRASNASNATFTFVGGSIDRMHRDCRQPIWRSGGRSGDYHATMDSEFPVAVYTTNGRDTYALVHNEWRGACDGKAWVNTITVLHSDNGGRTFARPSDYQVRRVPTRWDPAFCKKPPIFGSFNPSNIIKKEDWYYTIFGSGRAPDGVGAQGACLLRTQNLGAGSAWQVWTSAGWQSAQNAIECQPLPGLAGSIIGGIVYSHHLKKYVAIYSAPRIVVSVSDDLINWSGPIKVPLSVGGYPSLLATSNNTAVTGLNFENIEQEAWVYYLLFKGGELPRRLVRQKVRFERFDPSAAPAVASTPKAPPPKTKPKRQRAKHQS
jgi:hypothetical protein